MDHGDVVIGKVNPGIVFLDGGIPPTLVDW
jgi:hypothetical protein